MGGGVIRTAAKAAAVGAFRSPLIDEAGRRAARQQVPASPSFAPSVETGQSMPILSAEWERVEAPVIAAVAHWPDCYLYDWEIAGGIEESFGSVDAAPRLVFGPSPTLEEAKEATADLKDAFEKVYFTPNHNLNYLEGGKAAASGESGTVSTVSKPVAKMFSLLQGSPEAQDVVASLASDKNVWDAVMKNEKVLEFCKSTPTVIAQMNIDTAESVAEKESFDNLSPTVEVEEASKGSIVMNLAKNIKFRVSQMVSNISNFIQDFLGISKTSDSGSSGEKATSTTADSYTNAALGTSFMAFAVAAIVVVLLKRG